MGERKREKVLNKDGSDSGDNMLEYNYDEYACLGEKGKFSLLEDKEGREFLEEKDFDYFLASECYYRRRH